jgi:hypothetical protein
MFSGNESWTHNTNSKLLDNGAMSHVVGPIALDNAALS